MIILIVFASLGGLIAFIGARLDYYEDPGIEILASIVGMLMGAVISYLCLALFTFPSYTQQTKYYGLKDISPQGIHFMYARKGDIKKGDIEKGWVLGTHQSYYDHSVWIEGKHIDTTQKVKRLKIVTYTQTQTSFWYSHGFMIIGKYKEFYLHAPGDLLEGEPLPPVNTIEIENL